MNRAVLAALLLFTGGAAATPPPHEVMVPVPPGQVTLRQVWEGTIATEAEVIIALPEPGLFETPTSLPRDHGAQVPLDVALDAIAEPLDLVWFSTPSGPALAYPRPLPKRAVARRGVGREALASWCMAWGLLRSLPTDQDRARFLSGEWVQPLSWDCPYGRAVRRAIRQADDAAVRELDKGDPSAVILTVWSGTYWRPAGGGAAKLFGTLNGGQHPIPPSAELVPLESPTRGGPRSFATARWRERVASLRARELGAREPWRLRDYVASDPDLSHVLADGGVTCVTPVPVEPRGPLGQCLTNGCAVVTSEAVGSAEMLVSMRERGAQDALGMLSLALEAGAKQLPDGLFVGPGIPAGYAWAIEEIGCVLDSAVRPGLSAMLAATGSDGAYADQAWACLVWRPVEDLTEDQLRMVSGVMKMLGPLGDDPEPVPAAAAELATMIAFGLRVGLPAEEWDLSGPRQGYAVTGHAFIPGSTVGPLEPRVGQSMTRAHG